MENEKKILVIILLLIGISSCTNAAEVSFQDKNKGMIVRIFEIEVYPQY